MIVSLKGGHATGNYYILSENNIYIPASHYSYISNQSPVYCCDRCRILSESFSRVSYVFYKSQTSQGGWTLFVFDKLIMWRASVIQINIFANCIIFKSCTLYQWWSYIGLITETNTRAVNAFNGSEKVNIGTRVNRSFQALYRDISWRSVLCCWSYIYIYLSVYALHKRAIVESEI